MLVAGVFFHWLYIDSPNRIINKRIVENTILQKEKKADVNIRLISKMLENGFDDSLKRFASKSLSGIYYVYKGDKLIFWSNNELVNIPIESPDWKYYLTPNAHVLAKSVSVKKYRIVSYIPLKYNFPYENNELSNDFASGFYLNKEINIVQGNSKDKFAIHNRDVSRNYIFTLQPPENTKLYNDNWAKIAFILFALAFLILFYLYARFPFLIKKTHISSKEFLIISSVMFLILVFCLIFDIPSTFFQNNIFTSFHYASNPLLATLTHLSLFTFYVFSTVFLFSYSVKKGISGNFRYIKNTILMILPATYYLLMFYILIGLVYNSGTDLNILSVSNLKATSLWNHFLLLIWGVGYMLLFIKTHRTVKKQNGLFEVVKIDIFLFILVILLSILFFKNYASKSIHYYIILTLVLYLPNIFRRLMHSVWYLALFFVFFTLFVVNNSVKMNSDKKLSQYRLLAENLYYNESSQEEKITETMFLDLDKELIVDNQFKETAIHPDSVIKTNEYLNESYFRGYWAKFEMKLISSFPHTDVDKSYQELINTYGNKIGNSHFYKISSASTDMTYLGFYKIIKNNTDSVNVFLEFYLRSNYKSYSYPSLLVQTPPTIQTKLSLSTARYSHKNLIYSSGKFKFPRNGKWINEKKEDFFVQDFAGSRHYIYAPSKYNFMVVSEANIPNAFSYFLYYLYTYVAFLLICLTFTWLYNILDRREKIVYNLTSKLFISFITLMAICFAAIFYVSYGYIQKKYKEKQLTDIGLKKNYIQNALQEKYYWDQKLDSTITSKLNFDLQDLSYTYQTDINVYDNTGNLVATSQPAIFSKNITGKYISPKPFFSNNSNLAQYEHIGKLEYLAVYTDFYNGEFLPIGYVSIPQFLSKDEYNADVQSFLVVIAHITLIIIILFTLISIFIGKRLTAPLRIIENRLKDIRLGKENKKIDYKGTDEIGQLVTQYNRTVDELERSAHLLATSERESAWRVMARQVAHEINNPLTPMKLTIQQLQRTKKLNSEQFETYFDKSTATLIEQIENLTKIASSFSTFARLPEPEFEKVDVAKNISLVVQLFSNNNEKIEITYEGEEEGVFAYTDREQLIQVFNNLLKNGLQAIPKNKNGIIHVKLNYTKKDIFITFEDNGNGIPEDIKDKLFVPNFTTKSTGTGLGLAISKNIILASNGDITFESKKNEGTVFIVRLPKMR